MYAMRDLSCFVGRNVFSSIRPSPGTSELRKIVLRWFRVFPFGAIAGRSVKQQNHGYESKGSERNCSDCRLSSSSRSSKTTKNIWLREAPFQLCFCHTTSSRGRARRRFNHFCPTPSSRGCARRRFSHAFVPPPVPGGPTAEHRRKHLYTPEL